MMIRCVPLRRLVLCLLVWPAAGCVEAPPQTVRGTRPAEPAWENQVQHVRSGESTEVRFLSQAVAPDQWQMLHKQCQPLEVLEVDAGLLSAKDLQLLADLPELRRLKLTGPVDDAGLQQIAAATGLTMLNVPEGVFSDEGLQQLETLQNLELLRFGSTNVTDDGLAVIPRLSSLRFLHLINVPITDTGLKHLHAMTGLESFYLDGGRCTDAGLYALLQALPGLHFHRDQLHLPDDPHAHPHADAAGSD